MDVVDEAYEKAMDILRQNVTPLGFSASPEKIENYNSVWARDHSICALAAVLSGDKHLIKVAIAGTLRLLQYQVDHGQVPSYIEIKNRKKVYGGLGLITSVDSNLWVAIAAAVLYKYTKDLRLISYNNWERYKKLYRLYKAFDSNDCGLMEVHIASDWADVFNRTYHVLYTECLYYEALRAIHYMFKEITSKIKVENVFEEVDKRINWISQRKPKVKRRINEFFWWTKDTIPKVKEEYMIYEDIPLQDYNYYQSHLMPFKNHWYRRFDTFGNLMAIVTNVTNNKRKKMIIDYILRHKINEPSPIRVLHPAVHKRDKDWEPIYRIKEQPHTYHNGGIWPLVAGFWIHSLIKGKRHGLATKELRRFAEAQREHGYKFHEYMHGKTGKPMGKTLQAWSAAGYIIGYNSVHRKIKLFDF